MGYAVGVVAFVVGFIIGAGMAGDLRKGYVASGVMSYEGKAYRITPLHLP